ncbi:MAG: preprotein translocase subunit SecY [Rhodospirillaceae bacterium]|jgi:preprotein translocase subunit SecY|nr:preprotein translocase subunit SecY [Rhodospirillaceae bacterium]
MASAYEQLVANLNFGVFSKAIELKKRIWFTLITLIVYRFGTWIPIPGVDPHVLVNFFSNSKNGILGMFDMLAGGALSRMTIFALNIMPYISSSIIMQLMTTAVPSLELLKKEGAQGRKKINQYTRYFTVLIAMIQAYGIAVGLEMMTAGNNGALAVFDPGGFFRFTTVITLVGGTMFLMWLGEQITARGIGNGTSLIIFVGIVANLPNAIISTLELGRTGALSAILIAFLIIMIIGVIVLIVYVERAHRRIIIQYPNRQIGNKIYAGDASHLPLKINTSGVIPPIFASSILLMPVTVSGFLTKNDQEWLGTIATLLSHGQPLYLILYLGLIIFFAFFYTSIVFNPVETSDNLKKNGGFIPGIRPGANTADHLDYVLTRLTIVGATYLSSVSILPEILISRFSVPFYFGGTSLLIVVTVTIDTVSQIQSHLLAHQYESLIKKSKLRKK